MAGGLSVLNRRFGGAFSGIKKLLECLRIMIMRSILSILVGVIVVVAGPVAGNALRAEPLDSVIAAYNEAATIADGHGDVPPRDDATWLATLTDAADRHRGDPLEATVLGYARLHANVLGKWEDSARILERLLALEPDRNQVRAQLLTEIGEIRKQIAAKTRLDSDRSAARLAFEEANAIYAELSSVGDEDGTVQEAMLLNKAWISQLFAESQSTTDRQAAAASFRSLREGVERYRASRGEPRHRLAVAGWTPLKIAEQEAMEALVNEQYDEATEAIEQIAKAKDRTLNPSHCIISAAYRRTLITRENVAGYVKFLESTLRSVPEDQGTCLVRYFLAEALLLRGDKAQARSILEDLRDHSFEAFDAIEPNSLEQGTGGTFSFVLRTLRDIEAEDGDVEKALATNRFYLDLYPNDGGLTTEARSFAERIAAETRLSEDPGKPVLRRSWRSVLLWGNVVLIGVLVAWVLIRNRLHRRLSTRGESQ